VELSGSGGGRMKREGEERGGEMRKREL